MCSILSSLYFGKSTVDWCETNYVVVNFIAEFWNTLSAVFILSSAMSIGQIKYCNSHMYNVFIYLLVVSLGTALFHSTLLFKYQLLDELPMLFVAKEYIQLITSTKLAKYNKLNNPNTLLSCTIYLIPFVYLINPQLQIALFHIVLKIYEGYLVYILIIVNKTSNKIAYDAVSAKHQSHFIMTTSLIERPNTKTDKKNKTLSIRNIQNDLHLYIQTKKQLTNHMYKGIALYSLSISTWVLENLFCEQVRFLQLHAWWHLLSSIGIFYLNKMMECYIKINELL